MLFLGKATNRFKVGKIEAVSNQEVRQTGTLRLNPVSVFRGLFRGRCGLCGWGGKIRPNPSYLPNFRFFCGKLDSR